MRPPKGFESEKYPLRHKLLYACGLSPSSDNINSVLMPVVMGSKDAAGVPLQLPSTIKVNPHNPAFEQETGPLVQQMSIIDRMRISLKFTMTHYCADAHLSSGTAGPNFDDGVYVGDDVRAIKFLWRPIFNVYPEKLDAADDDTGDTVAAILGLTKDATNEDIVPVTTNDLPSAGASELVQPMSTANGSQVFGDFNLTTNTIQEDHVHDEDLLQKALQRYTNKGALRSCLGRTRHVTLTTNRPYVNFYIDKFVPRAIRRIQPYAFFAIQVHVPIQGAIDQIYNSRGALTASVPHLGVQMISRYHEWNFEYDQDRGVPT